MSELEMAKTVSKRMLEIFPKPIDQEHLDPILIAIMGGRLVVVDRSAENRLSVEIAPKGVGYYFPSLDRQ